MTMNPGDNSGGGIVLPAVVPDLSTPDLGQDIPQPVRIAVGNDRSKRGPVKFELAPHIRSLFFNYLPQLDMVYDGFRQAASEVEKARGAPLCVDGCGQCCHTVPISTGLEAEYAASILLGSPNLKWILEKARAWLTSVPAFKANYGRKVTRESYQREILPQMIQVVETETCPFLQDDMKCGVWLGRPAVCRGYGATHVPNPWCSRPIGAGESVESRVSWDAAVPFEPGTPSLKQRWEKLKSEMLLETRYSREGFFPMMLYERLRAADLAAICDEGKVPLARMTVGLGGGSHMTLWQEQLDEEWGYKAADLSIEQAVPLKEVDGKLIMSVGDTRR